MRKNDIIKWSARFRFIAIDFRKDSSGKDYALIKTDKGSRVLSWDTRMNRIIQCVVETLSPDKLVCEGYVNQVIGNSFLVLTAAEKIDDFRVRISGEGLEGL